MTQSTVFALPLLMTSPRLEPPVMREPELPRKLRLWPHQWVGIPLLLAIPLLALLGVFGEATGQAVVGSDQLEVTIEYPKRLRYGFPEEIRLQARNKTERPLRNVHVDLDENFLDGFSDIQVRPASELESAHRVRIDELAPGESHAVSVELRGRKYGAHEGRVKAFVGSAQVADAKLESFVFP